MPARQVQIDDAGSALRVCWVRADLLPIILGLALREDAPIDKVLGSAYLRRVFLRKEAPSYYLVLPVSYVELSSH